MAKALKKKMTYNSRDLHVHLWGFRAFSIFDMRKNNER